MSEPPQGWSSPGGTPPEPAGSGAPDGWQAPAGWGPPAGGPAGAGPAPWGTPRPPDVRPGVIPLRPLGLGELLDGAVQVIRRYPRPTLGLSALIAAVITVLNALVLFSAVRPLARLSGTETGQAELDAEIGGLLAGGLGAAVLTALGTVVLSGVITAVVGKAVLGQPVSFGDAWTTVKPLIWRLLGVALLSALLIGAVLVVGVGVAAAIAAVVGAAGLVLAVPLGVAAVAAAVYLYAALSLAAPALVLERCGVLESLRRSRVLVRRSWWRVFGILVLTALIVGVVSNVLQIPFAVVGTGSAFLSGELAVTSWPYIAATAIGGGIAQALVAPFESGVRALLYVDRRMRAEGLDVALQASLDPPQPR